MRLSDLPIRDALRGLQPYGAPQIHVPISLNVNENTHGVPASVVSEVSAAIHEAVGRANRYPSLEFPRLREALAEYLGHGLDALNIWAANGSNEVLQQFLQAFGGHGRTLLSFAPTYSMYPLLASNTDTDWRAVTRSGPGELSTREVIDALRMHRPDIVILCSPNNPTGSSLTLEVVEAAYEAFDGMLIVDEAYKEFDDSESALSLLPSRHRLVVTRTMSKAFAFAGVRLGYLAADPAVADALRLVRLPYHLSVLTQASAETALAHADSMLSSVGQIVEQRGRLIRELTSIGYEPHPSSANFVLVGGFENPRLVFDTLLERGILVREAELDGHLRITVGTEHETTSVLAAIRELAPRASR